MSEPRKDEPLSPIVNIDDAPEEVDPMSDHWGSAWKVLTPTMRPRGGRLGVCLTRLPKGHVGCPFHAHQREDEVFIVQSGRGVLRYGDTLYDLKPGDCISCPAGTGVAHQIANPYDEDLVYFGIGDRDPHEVCVYPDSGKVMVRSLGAVGRLAATEYMAGEPEVPAIFAMIAARG